MFSENANWVVLGPLLEPSNREKWTWDKIKNFTDRPNSNSVFSSPWTKFRIKEWILHPNAQPPAAYHDIALVKLNKDVLFTQYTHPICLHTEYDIPETSAIASGWGLETVDEGKYNL